MKQIAISEIRGFKVGHAQNVAGGTGCTAIICEDGAVAGVAVRGGAPATRETELLNPVNMVQKIHCVMLSGGSAYGLEASTGAMQYLEEQNIGFNVGVGVVPIVCAAALFDLGLGDAKCRPDKEMGYEACKNAGATEVLEGNVGAGTGATIGKYFGPVRMMKSGLGVYAMELGEVQCAAIVAVNAFGDVFDYDTKAQVGGLLSADKTALASTKDALYEEICENRQFFSGNTTIGCIITNAKLDKAQCNKLASIAHDGFAHVIHPVHTTADGDAIFVMATGEVNVNPDALGTLATEVMGRAIVRGVKAAEAAYGLSAAKDFE